MFSFCDAVLSDVRLWRTEIKESFVEQIIPDNSLGRLVQTAWEC